MTVISSRMNRILIAAAAGLAIAVVCALFTEKSPSAGILRGDFPAFYTLATIAASDGARLYDLELQRHVQNSIWPTLAGSVLPAAYPPYLAFALRPLAALDVGVARGVWVVGMMVATLLGVYLLARSRVALRPITWQLMVGVLLFAPLFVGILGSQIVGFSFLLYAIIIATSLRQGCRAQIVLGLATGLWMFKPHYALAVVAILLFQRRWLAFGVWGAVSVVLWALGAYVVGADWISQWLAFVTKFSLIDLETNAHQMTGIIAVLYNVAQQTEIVHFASPRVWTVLTTLVALVVPLGLLVAVRMERKQSIPGISLPFLVLGPLLVLCAPAVNFYDLALGLVPVLMLMRPHERRDVIFAIGVIVASQVALILKETSAVSVQFVMTILMVVLTLKGIRRELVKAVERTWSALHTDQ